MKNNSIFYLAHKYLRNRSRWLLGRSHYLTLAGITLGVLALIAVSSVMNGFQADMQDRLISTLSELRISSADGSEFVDYQELEPKLQALGFKAAPVIRNELMLKFKTQVTPTVSFGIDILKHQKVAKVLGPAFVTPGGMQQGILQGSADRLSLPDGGIVLGAGLAYQLGASVGDTIQILSPTFSQPTAFGMLPQVKTLEVLAVFSAGMPEYDQSFSYIPLNTAAWFRSYYSGIDYLEISTPDKSRVRAYSNQLRKAYPQYKIEDWSSFDSSLYAAMRFEKFLMFVIMLFMYIIASFNLTGNMLKLISQKKKELGLLKAIGYQDIQLRNLFLIQSFILSSLGIALGLLLSTSLLLLQRFTGLIKLPISEAEFITLPVQFKVTDYLLVIIISYAFTLLSVLFPLQRLKRIDAVALIRQTA